MLRIFRSRLVVAGWVVVALFCGCNDSTKVDQKKLAPESAPFQPKPAPTRKAEYDAADIRILFIGNSHTSTGMLPRLVQQMLNSRQSRKKVYCESCVNSFLVDHLKRSRTTDRIKQGKWDLVVLQAQKYSVSGKYDYPFDAALELTAMAEKNGAKVMMYPEWGQRKNASKQELERCLAEANWVQKLHEKIVDQSGASIVPVGLVWNAALKANPDWRLHSDGNHANSQGVYLTACVFDQVISAKLLQIDASQKTQLGQDVVNEQLVTPEVQEKLFQVAREAVHKYLNRKMSQQ